MKLWLVEIIDEDWDYDNFAAAAVWAHSQEDAERIVRAELRYPNADNPSMSETLWIENPEWRLTVREAPTEGVVLVHWHAG